MMSAAWLIDILERRSAISSFSATRRASHIVADSRSFRSDHAIYESESLRFLRFDEVACPEIFLRLLHAEFPEVGWVLVVRSAPAHGTVGELSVFSGHDKIAR